MSINNKEINFYKKNGFLLKDELISKKDINNLISKRIILSSEPEDE